MAVLFVENDNSILLKGMRNKATRAYVNDLTATATVYDPEGNPVPNLSGLSMTYTTGSNGDYRATIPAAAQLIERAKYKIVVQGSNYGVKFTETFEAKER